MPVVSSIFNVKCLNQLINGLAFGTDTLNFTPNLVGNVGEKVRMQYDVEVYWFAETQASENWAITVGGSTVTIVKPQGSFIDEGFAVGQDVFLSQKGYKPNMGITPTTQLTGEITSMSADGTILVVTFLSNSLVTGAITDVALFGVIYQLAPSTNYNLWDAVYVDWGLVENNDSFSNVSLTSGSQQTYYGSGLFTPGGSRTMEALGTPNDWVNGTMSAQQFSIGGDFVGYVRITHDFVIDPLVLAGLGVADIPSFLAGKNSLKYVTRVRRRPTLTSPVEVTAVHDEVIGSTGWYDENFDGLDSFYTIVSSSYEDNVTGDPATGIKLVGQTKVTVEISRTGGFAIGEAIGVYHYRIPANESEYVGTTTTWGVNFQYEVMLGVINTPQSVPSNNVLKELATSINGSGNLVIELVCEYSTAYKQRLFAGDGYVLAFTHQKAGEVAGSASRVMLPLQGEIAAASTIEGLLQVTDADYYSHDKVIGVDLGSAATTAWNEDGYVLKGQFYLETASDAFLESILFNLVGADANGSFVLNTLTIPTSQFPIANGVQQIAIDTTRGYQLAVGDQFNYVKIAFDQTIGTKNYYDYELAFKVTWQFWRANNNVPLSFFDGSQPNNNRNLKASNYSGVGGYQIKAQIVGNSTGTDDFGRAAIGLDVYNAGNIAVKNYGVSDDGLAVTAGVITFHDPDTLANTGGVVLQNKDTLFRVTWTVGTADITDGWAVHRAQRTNSNGFDIQELSSIWTPLAGILKPKDGFSGTDIYISGSDVVSECLIDFTQLTEGQAYNFSARIELPFAGDTIAQYEPLHYNTTTNYE